MSMLSLFVPVVVVVVAAAAVADVVVVVPSDVLPTTTGTNHRAPVVHPPVPPPSTPWAFIPASAHTTTICQHIDINVSVAHRTDCPLSAPLQSTTAPTATMATGEIRCSRPYPVPHAGLRNWYRLHPRVFQAELVFAAANAQRICTVATGVVVGAQNRYRWRCTGVLVVVCCFMGWGTCTGGQVKMNRWM